MVAYPCNLTGKLKTGESQGGHWPNSLVYLTTFRPVGDFVSKTKGGQLPRLSRGLHTNMHTCVCAHACVLADPLARVHTHAHTIETTKI